MGIAAMQDLQSPNQLLSGANGASPFFKAESREETQRQYPGSKNIWIPKFNNTQGKKEKLILECHESEKT